MASLPVVSGDEVCRALSRAGFLRRSQRGSHVKMKHADGRNAVVPLHRELALGTLRSVLKQAGLSDDEFRALL
ncbi:MAG TPA: type II toxin-antitoxin system HicA family toxin [Vicinamibacteria bacterium]|nr:type II toxin-antitoxin system HicA family toxin [Vicinamibacteria bacterium]